jgi:hypothetical protein
VRSLRNVSPLRKNFDRTGSLEFEKTFVQKKFLMLVNTVIVEVLLGRNVQQIRGIK